MRARKIGRVSNPKNGSIMEVPIAASRKLKVGSTEDTRIVSNPKNGSIMEVPIAASRKLKVGSTKDTRIGARKIGRVGSTWNGGTLRARIAASSVRKAGSTEHGDIEHIRTRSL